MPEESHNQEDFKLLRHTERKRSIPLNCVNDAIFRFAQDDETKHVIVSESETIQSIDNQNQLQENKYAPTSKSKISVLPQGVDMKSNSSPQQRNEFADGRRESSPDSLVFPRHLWERGRVRGVSKNNNKLLIIDWIVSHTLTMTKNFPNSAILRGLNNCSPQNDGKNSCRLTRGDVGKLKCKVAFTLAEGATHVALSNNSRKVAFTLAEVLITLGIIGVVAVLTIPTLIKNYQKQVTVTKLQKAYSVINQAIKQSEAVNDSSEFWDDPFVIRSQAYFEKYLKPYLNGAKQCFSYQECGYTERCPYKYLNNTKFVTSMDSASLKSDRFAFYLPDGTFYCFLVSATGADGESVPNNTLYIDINGGQGPNIVSKDVFIFERVAGKGILPYGYKYSKSRINLNCSTSGYFCAMKIMQDGWKITYPY